MEQPFFLPRDYFTTEELVDLTQSLIRIPSHKDTPGQERDIAHFIHHFLQQHHIESVLHPVIDERSNVIARVMGNGTGRSLMFNGHTDTVLPYNMTVDPYAAEIKNGCIFGRGAVDMKGALACFMMTLIMMRRSGFVPGGDVIFTGVIGEEGKSEGTEYVVKSDIRADAAVVGEPSDYEYAVGHRGLEWFDVIIRGKASHSGRPDKGVNAIEHAMTFIQRVKQDLYPILKEKYDEYTGESVMNFGTITGGTEQSTVADRCIIRLDRRYIPGETKDSVMAEYQEIIDRLQAEDNTFKAEIRVTPESLLELYHPPLITSVNEPIVSAVRESIRDVIHREPTITRGIGWSDAALLKTYANIPTVVFGPGDLSLAHTEEEHIAIDDLVNGVDIYARLVQHFTTLPPEE
ncbi:M20 family metallopeptidase [Anoxynatronum buryatiense]|uniref:Probable succinyl-diaminopimelate desuccinylase n=1 Tax=Anoxynatronum buryatiense TaxID=489973 RepID=A0AA45WUH4_9CLOT|nr:M20 family metallopeptidase [Anoxynatronum buryatiense]SMP46506.1 acetylornithine deacetylase/succinyl-diaminopimelate desuccinylase [Anoxynatronum buryatiense]